MECLVAGLQGWSKTKIKQRLQSGCVLVNGESVTKHNFELKKGDVVDVEAAPKNGNRIPRLEVLYSDDDIVAINKPAGLLSVRNPQEQYYHAHAILCVQLSRSKRPMRLWPVNRLDRETSGVMLFSKSRQMREILSENWSKAEKTYLAVVQGVPEPLKGMIDQPLRLDAVEYRMHVGAHPKAKDAVTHYETKRTVKGRSLVELKLETGRQHQIRAHLAWLGTPVVGDQRYGTNGPRMGLHAISLSILQPTTKKRLVFKTPAPKDFYDLIDRAQKKA